MFRVNQYGVNFQNPVWLSQWLGIIAVCQWICWEHRYACHWLCYHYQELASRVGSFLGSIQNLSDGKAECWGNYLHNPSKTHVCLGCPWNHLLKKKVFKAIILVSADVARMFQRIASNFGSSSPVVFNQGRFCPPGDTWQYLAVTAEEGGGYNWHLVGRNQGRC